MGKGMKRSTLGSGGQRSRSHEAKDRFVGLAEVLCSTPWVEWISSLVCFYDFHSVAISATYSPCVYFL